MEPHDDLTTLLTLASRGDPRAAAAVTPLIYQELHRLACERAPRGLGRECSPTALVHEAYLRLMGGEMNVEWAGRQHFFAVSAIVMRRMVLDALERRRAGRGGGSAGHSLGQAAQQAAGLDFDPLDIADALERLALLHPQQAQIAEWKIYVGLSAEEIGSLLGIPERTIEVEWAHARGFLMIELQNRPSP